MFFLLIWRCGEKTAKDCGPAYSVKCGNCKIDTYYHLTRVKTWITWFRLPVIPYLTEYFFTCHDCKAEYRLDKDGIRDAKRMVKRTALYLKGEITKEEYSALMSKPESAGNICNPDNSWECPNCKRDNRNSSYKCSHCGYSVV